MHTKRDAAALTSKPVVLGAGTHALQQAVSTVIRLLPIVCLCTGRLAVRVHVHATIFVKKAYSKHTVSSPFASRAEKPLHGGMLAHEMGVGKTLCAIAAHALTQHLLPDEPVMHTQHSDDDMKQWQMVYVGKRWPEEPEREKLKETKMYTGFEQLDDGRGTIVPDGSVRCSLLCVVCVLRCTPRHYDVICLLCDSTLLDAIAFLAASLREYCPAETLCDKPSRNSAHGPA